MDNILLIGAGGQAKSILDCISSDNKYDKIGILVDYGCDELLGHKVIGKIDDAKRFINEYKYAIIAIGDNKIRNDLYLKLKSFGYSFPVIKHKTAYVSEYATVGEATILHANSFINAGSTVGCDCIINSSVSIDHDCKIGNSVHISPGATICGTSSVGDLSWICAGTTIIDHISVGSKSVIGAASLVNKDVTSNVLAYGSPIRVIKEII